MLERLGHQVDFPAGQACCGQAHFNTGYRPEALPMLRRYLDVFAAHDTVVTPSASCAAMVRYHYPVLAEQYGDGALQRRTAIVAPRIRELSELLIDVLGIEDVGAYYPHRVTYHPTCHSLRALGVDERPLRLLRAVRGIDLVDLPAADSCCGFGGTFAVKNADTSTAMLADKLANVAASGAEVLSAADNSCLMHIGGGLSRLHAGVRPVHLAQILASTENDALET
jgi:L-lactate dehydrogenase complex protein LldE